MSLCEVKEPNRYQPVKRARFHQREHRAEESALRVSIPCHTVRTTGSVLTVFQNLESSGADPSGLFAR